ncbi:hypothetical protein AB0F49_25060 [Micromonospora ureilytica]|uniref:hypothetical protein n=1 Tax=Micromonospora ureilytica TaxID=709868 RepID=UPI0033F51CEB
MTAKTVTALGMPLVLTSSLAAKAQGLLMPELRNIAPQEDDTRLRRSGMSTPWQTPTRPLGQRHRDIEVQHLKCLQFGCDVGEAPRHDRIYGRPTRGHRASLTWRTMNA